MSKCLNCDKNLTQTEGKREKRFCNSTCRSNYWQKQKVLSKKPSPLQVVEAKREMALAKLKLTAPPNPNSILIGIQDLNKQTNKIDPQKPLGSEKSNFTVNNIPPMPKREDFADAMDYSFAKSEWKRKYNQ
jgi:hypothetical protein